MGAALKRLAGRLPGKEAAFLACLGVLALLGLGLIDRLQREDLAARERQVLQENRLALRGVDQQVRRLIETVTTLHEIAAVYWLSRTSDDEVAQAPLEKLLAEASHSSRFGVMQVAITDTKGLMLWSTVPGFRVTDLADREHIRMILAGWSGLFISKPLIGRVSNRKSINITRAIRAPDGTLAGVSVVALDPISFSDEMAQIYATSDAVVSVLREDGTILARSSEPDAYVGTRISDAYARRVAMSERGDSLNSTTLDGRRTFSSWQRVGGFPLWLFYGQPAAPLIQANAEYGQQMRLTLTLLVFGFGAAGLFTISVARRRTERADAEVAEARSREMTELSEALPGVAYRGSVAAAADSPELPLALPLQRVLADKGQDVGALAPLPELLDAEGAANRADLVRQLRADGQASTEYRISAPDIGTHWVREQCRVLNRADDGALEIVCMLSDITKERDIAANAITSSKLATLGEMATGVAHELNQPCAIIGIATEVALIEMERGREEDLASARNRLEEVLAQTDRMRRIINHLRAFSRPDASPEEPLSLAAAVEGALGIATGVLRDGGVRVTCNVPAELPQVMARLVPLEQVLVSLLLNARDAMTAVPASEREIIVTGDLDPDRPDMVRLRLHDRGHGVPPDVLPRVFEPFFTTRPVGKGNGLGLSIAYGTITGCGGSIDLVNHPDGGAVATIWLKKA